MRNVSEASTSGERAETGGESQVLALSELPCKFKASLGNLECLYKTEKGDLACNSKIYCLSCTDEVLSSIPRTTPEKDEEIDRGEKREKGI